MVTQANIIGTGPAGLAAALQLIQNNGIRCHIYEIHPEVSTLGGAISIPSNGVKLLDCLVDYGTLATRASMKSAVTLWSVKGYTLGMFDMIT